MFFLATTCPKNKKEEKSEYLCGFPDLHCGKNVAGLWQEKGR